jgi:hypothetical protein
LRANGTLKDASEIVWYNDKDDDMPIVSASTVQTGKFLFDSLPPHVLNAFQSELNECETLHGCKKSLKQSNKLMTQTRVHDLGHLAREKMANANTKFYLTPKTSHMPQLYP